MSTTKTNNKMTNWKLLTSAYPPNTDYDETNWKLLTPSYSNWSNWSNWKVFTPVYRQILTVMIINPDPVIIHYYSENPTVYIRW